jgi:hypothetical protein
MQLLVEAESTAEVAIGEAGEGVVPALPGEEADCAAGRGDDTRELVGATSGALDVGDDALADIDRT